MSPTKSEVGVWGEDLASRYLVDHGFVIRARNWRHGHGEIDIVAEHDGVIVFVEVRTRRSDTYGAPEESVRAAKQAKLIETAQAFLDVNGLSDVQWQIDFVAVELDARNAVRRIDHIPCAISQPS